MSKEEQLYDAVHEGDIQKLKQLIAMGADINYEDEILEETVWWVNPKKNRSAIMQVLIDAGADINVQNEFGATLLIRCVNAGLLEATKVLIQAGADQSIKNSDGQSARDILEYQLGNSAVRERWYRDNLVTWEQGTDRDYEMIDRLLDK